MSRPFTSSRGRQRQAAMWRWGSQVVITLICLVFAGIIVILFLPEIQDIRKLKDEQDRLQSEVDAQHVQNEKRKQEIQWIQNDPSYFEIKARDTLDLMKEGETIVRPLPSVSPMREPLNNKSERK